MVKLKIWKDHSFHQQKEENFKMEDLVLEPLYKMGIHLLIVQLSKHLMEHSMVYLIYFIKESFIPKNKQKKSSYKGF